MIKTQANKSSPCGENVICTEGAAHPNICSPDNVIRTEGAAHRKNEIEFKDEYVFEFFDDVRWE